MGGDQHDQRIMKNEYQETGGSIVGQLSGNGNFLFQPDSKGHEKKRPEDWAEGIQMDSRPGDIPYSIGCQYFVHVPFRVILANAQVIGDAEQKPGSYGEQDEGSKGIFVNVFYFSQFDGRQEKAQTEQGDGGWSKGNLVGRHGVLEPVRAEADQDQDKNRIFQFQQDGGNEGTENDIPQKPCGRGKGSPVNPLMERGIKSGVKRERKPARLHKYSGSPIFMIPGWRKEMTIFQNRKGMRSV